MVALAKVGPHAHHQRIAGNGLAATTGFLPAGFVYLLCHAGKIIEPVLFYLRAKCAFSGVLRSRWTNLTYAEHLYEWFSLLEALGTPWDEVTEQDLIAYSSSLSSHVSSHTKTEIKPSTRKGRMRTILAFYRFAHIRGWISKAVTLDEENILHPPQNRVALAHIQRNRPAAPRSDILDHIKVPEPAPPMCIDETALGRIFFALGPTSSIGRNGVSCRDRLIAEIGLNGGPRLAEVASLTVRQILALVPNSKNPNSPCKLLLTKTKGFTARNVFLPSWLVRELHAYIDHERQEVVDTARAAKPDTYKEPETLFLSLPTANVRDIGESVSRETIMRRFRQAVERCSLFHTVPAVDPRTGNRFLKNEAKYTFHNLRHTFAYTAYITFHRNGDAFPWNKVQILLGHAHLSTTIDIYLKGAGTNEIEVSDAIVETFSGWRDLVDAAA
ncbi:tyrosine-type recombinase/integrase [Paraburkholderia bryophila]|uniref:Integrase n=1 Tax=Paraburkholderia bryophila TaxID=420952 RepID=A0A7Y9WQC3_9BURK|nr:site-specific integrase [Paraburkholderia bryophila]NYH24241.1 integrase [Paraburkholderia bryophila]